MQVRSFNARVLGDRFKRREVFIWLKRQNCNIVFLQETHSIKSREFIWKSEWGGRIWFSHVSSQAKGVAIMITKNIDCKVLEVERDAEGRFIIVKVEIKKKRYLLGNVYGPNTDDPEFFY